MKTCGDLSEKGQIFQPGSCLQFPTSFLTKVDLILAQQGSVPLFDEPKFMKTHVKLSASAE